jgi:hypothetical protein
VINWWIRIKAMDVVAMCVNNVNATTRVDRDATQLFKLLLAKARTLEL